MSQVYSDPSRESDPHALPDVEVFHVGAVINPDGDRVEAGWYYQLCFPGCLPDYDPVGPFATAEEAKAEAQEE